MHRHAVEYSTYPRGPRSGPGCSVPVRHHLIGPIRPTRGHIAISPHGGLYAMPSLCGSALYRRPQTPASCKTHIFQYIDSGHILRHTWASLAVMAGVPLMVVAKTLGHSDTRMVEKHYGHLAPSFITEAIRPAPRAKDDK